METKSLKITLILACTYIIAHFAGLRNIVESDVETIMLWSSAMAVITSPIFLYTEWKEGGEA